MPHHESVSTPHKTFPVLQHTRLTSLDTGKKGEKLLQRNPAFLSASTQFYSLWQSTSHTDPHTDSWALNDISITPVPGVFMYLFNQIKKRRSSLKFSHFSNHQLSP
jgi:hypothetical protein